MVDLTRKAQGTEVEWQLCYVFQDFGYMVEPHQMNRDKSNRNEAAMALLPEVPYEGDSIIMPDITCWKHGSSCIVEVKSKYATEYGQYGLDFKRFHHLMRYQKKTGLPALYVVYDTNLSGGRLDDRTAFFYATVDDLDKSKVSRGQFYYWSVYDFKPLVPYLADLNRMTQHDDAVPEGIVVIPPHHDTGGIVTVH